MTTKVLTEGQVSDMKGNGVTVIHNGCDISASKDRGLPTTAWLMSCKLEDKLVIVSRFLSVKKASFELEQNILKQKNIIFKSKILMVCVNSQGAPNKIPDVLHSLMKNNDG